MSPRWADLGCNFTECINIDGRCQARESCYSWENILKVAMGLEQSWDWLHVCLSLCKSHLHIMFLQVNYMGRQIIRSLLAEHKIWTKVPYKCVSILYWSLSFWLTSLYILSIVKQITSPGWTHETSARAWCTGKTQRDAMEREAGGEIGKVRVRVRVRAGGKLGLVLMLGLG